MFTLVILYSIQEEDNQRSRQLKIKTTKDQDN